jgi:hypothetical protein
MLFSISFFKFLILFSLLLMSIGAITLIVMLFRDIKTDKLW